MFEFLQTTYAAALPDIEPAQTLAVLHSAVQRARTKHNDWDHFQPAIEHLSTVVFTDHHRIPLDDYLETLYCAVKHGDFSRKWRDKLRTLKAPAAAAPAVTQ